MHSRVGSCANYTVPDLSVCTRACQGPEVVLSDVRFTYHFSDKVPQDVDTDSMAPALSTQAGLRTRSSMTPPPEEADDEGARDGHVKHMEQFAMELLQGKWT